MYGTYQLDVFTCWNLNCKIKILILKKWVKRIYNCYKRKLCIPVLQDIYFFKKPRLLHIFTFTRQRVSLICIADKYFCRTLLSLWIGMHYWIEHCLFVFWWCRNRGMNDLVVFLKMWKLFFQFSSSTTYAPSTVKFNCSIRSNYMYYIW